MEEEFFTIYNQDNIWSERRPPQQKSPGNWFHGPFNDLAGAERYAKYLADLGQSGIRRESALPQIWTGGSAGNPIEIIRVYCVKHESPAISSVVAPQPEGATSL